MNHKTHFKAINSCSNCNIQIKIAYEAKIHVYMCYNFGLLTISKNIPDMFCLNSTYIETISVEF